MSKYQIIENGILISTTASGINLYKASKAVIDDYSSDIDINIQSIALCELLRTTVATIEIPQKDEFIDFQTNRIAFCELYCFFLNFSIDFSISSRELYLATNKSEQIFYIKSIYIELYRYLERHNKDLGIIKKLYGVSEEYKEYNRCLKEFRSNYYEQIKTNRNTFFAHLDNGARYGDYFEFTTNLDAEEVAKMCVSFLSVQEKLSIIYKQLSVTQISTTLAFGDLIQKRKEESDMEVQDKLEEIKGLVSGKQYIEIKSQNDNLHSKTEKTI
jgi:hypothetical protein